MPTEHQYRAAAERYRGVARQCAEQSAQVPSSPAAPFVDAPSVTTVIDRCLASTVRELAAVANEMFRLAVVCDIRADVCRRYRQALWGYRLAAADDREQMRPPVCPYSWIEL